MTKLKGSKQLGQWIESDKVEILERLNKTKVQDAMIVVKIKRTGKIAVIVPRKHRDSYAAGEPTRTQARRTQVETWPIDAHLAGRCRIHNPAYLILYITDTDDYWVSFFADWMDPAKRRRRTLKYSSAEVFHLPSHMMKHVPSHKLLSLA
jgi:hypothetical protein